MRETFHKASRWVWVISLVAAAGWTLGFLVAPAVQRDLRGVGPAPLQIGDSLPSLLVLNIHGVAEPLSHLVEREQTNTLIVLSAKCSACLGEIQSWNDLHKTTVRVRPLILVYTDSDSYLDYVESLIRPSIAVRRVLESDLGALGALQTPIAYEIGDNGTIVDRALGVEAGAGMRTAMGDKAIVG